MNTKTIALIGATGRSGKKVVREALKRGYRLKVLARNPKAVVEDDRITVIQGNALDKNSLDLLLENADAVVSTLGPAGINRSLRSAKQSAKDLLCYQSTKLLIPLMKKHEITRFALTGGASLSLPEDKNTLFINFALTKLSPLFLGALAVDRKKEYELLAQSDIDWTIARCGGFQDEEPTTSLKTSSTTFQGVKICTTHIAQFLLDQVEDKKFVRQAVYIAS